MSNILEKIDQADWEGAMELFSKRLDEGSITEEESVIGATILEHFQEWESMYDIITYGLGLNPQNYELYMLLGNYYALRNVDQTYLSYENALYLAEKQNALEDADVIRNIIKDLCNGNTITVRNVSFIILSFNTKEFTELCIDSIRKKCKKECYEIVVVDNASTDGSIEWLKEQDDIILIANDKNVGFPAGCNQGVQHANPENDVFLLNNDTLMMDNSLFLLRMGLYEKKNVGALYTLWRRFGAPGRPQ